MSATTCLCGHGQNVHMRGEGPCCSAAPMTPSHCGCVRFVPKPAAKDCRECCVGDHAGCGGPESGCGCAARQHVIGLQAPPPPEPGYFGLWAGEPDPSRYGGTPACTPAFVPKPAAPAPGTPADEACPHMPGDPACECWRAAPGTPAPSLPPGFTVEGTSTLPANSAGTPARTPHDALLDEVECAWDEYRETGREARRVNARAAVESAHREEVERLREALVRAIEAIDRAEANKHSPWCNGVHEGGACEGDYLMARFVEELREIAKVPRKA